MKVFLAVRSERLALFIDRLSRSALKATAGARSPGPDIGLSRPKRPRPRSYASSFAATCAASSSSSPILMTASRTRRSTLPGSAAACTSCATHWPMQDKSGRRVVSAFIATAFAEDDAEALARSGAMSPTSSVQACRLPRRRRDRSAAYMRFPLQHRTKLHSTNLERRDQVKLRSSASSPMMQSSVSSARSCSNRTTNSPSSLFVRDVQRGSIQEMPTPRLEGHSLSANGSAALLRG